MRFSIIIPIYNVQEYIEECITSILNQSFHDYEIICIDDGSTDQSIDIIQSFNDERIKIIYQKNSGQSVARNKGIEISQGEYIWFVDSDDKITFESLSEIDSIISKEPNIDCIFFNANTFFDNNYKLQKSKWFEYKRNFLGRTSLSSFFINEMKSKSFFVQPCTYIFKREKFKDIRFIENIIYEDNTFIIEMIWNHPDSECISLNKAYFMRRIRKNSTMTKKSSLKNFIGYNTCIEYLLNYGKKNNINSSFFYDFIFHLGFNNCIEAIKIYGIILPLDLRKKISSYKKIPKINFLKKIFFVLPQLTLIRPIINRLKWFK